MTSVHDHPTAARAHDPYQHIEVTKVGGVIGAVVSGIRAGGDVPPPAVAELRAALLRHRVVFLRGQQHATDADQRAFATLLGQLTRPHPTVAGDGTAILPIDAEQGKANSWHTDVTFVDRARAISVLRAITLPPYGGKHRLGQHRRGLPGAGTRGCRRWPRAARGALQPLRLRPAGPAADRRRNVKEEEYRAEFRPPGLRDRAPGGPAAPGDEEARLLLGHFVRSFTGLSSTDFQDLFGLLQRHITRLENTVRWTWTPRDIAIWDNRATQHYAVADYDEQPRRLHRVTIAGDVPVGINGDTSVVRKGDASHYSQLAA